VIRSALSLGFPLVYLLVNALSAPYELGATEFVGLLAANLLLVAVPHLVWWWFSTRVLRSTPAVLYGGLAGANIGLALFGWWFVEDGGLEWLLYWPWQVVAIFVGQLGGYVWLSTTNVSDSSAG
jgi:hypothetical protein